MSIDIQKLKALAHAATQGEWGYDGSYVCTARIDDGTKYVETWNAVADCNLPDNTKFIAAANPAAVLELIAEIERLRDSHQQVCENYNKVSYASEERGKQIDLLKAESERLQRFETAYKEFSDKTKWVVPEPAGQENGMHVADILRKRCDDLTSHCQAQAEEIKALRLDAERYRFIRSSNSKGKVDICVLHVRWNAGDQGREIICDRECDERIDTAMAQEQQP